MHLITFRKGSSKPRVGALVGEAALDLGALAADLARERGTVRQGRGGFPKTMLDLIARGPDALALAREALAHGEAVLKRDGIGALAERKLGLPADKARLEAPIPRPARNVFCLGRNYKEHAAERGAEAPTDPVYFTKAPECVLAPGGKIIHHAATQQLDYEVELTAGIGTAGGGHPPGPGPPARVRHTRGEHGHPPGLPEAPRPGVQGQAAAPVSSAGPGR